MGAVELMLEAAPRQVDSITGPEVGLILTLGEFVGASLVACLCGGSFRDEEGSLAADRRQASPWVSFCVLPSLLFLGTGFANIAVSWVEFPVKLVIKSSKLIPTMALATCVGNSRRFSGREYMAAALLCLGSASFSWGSGRGDAPPEMVFLGVAMLLCSITADAMAVNAQQWMMQREKLAPESLMLRQNFVSAAFTLVLMASTVGLRRLGLATLSCPLVVWYAAAVGLATALAIWANLHLIHEAGSVVQVCVSMLRKFLAIVVSYVMFPKPFCWLHGASIALVVAGVLLAAPRRQPTPRPPPLRRESRPLWRDGALVSACAGDVGGRCGAPQLEPEAQEP